MSKNGKPSLQELLADTVCKHCGEKFASVRVPVIGQRAQQFQQWTLGLQKHVMDKHPEVISEMMVLSMQFNGMLLLNQFSHADPQLNEEQDGTRHKVFKLCQRAMVSDAVIEKHIRDAACKGDAEMMRVEYAIDVCKEMRDVLTEALLYPDAPLVVTDSTKMPS